MSARKVMAAAFGDHEFWKQDTKRTYTAVAIALLSKGFTVEESAEILGQLWSATSDEYGA